MMKKSKEKKSEKAKGEKTKKAKKETKSVEAEIAALEAALGAQEMRVGPSGLCDDGQQQDRHPRRPRGRHAKEQKKMLRKVAQHELVDLDQIPTRFARLE